MRRWESSLLLIGILLVALSFRLVGLGWGENQPIHPDEEFLRQVTAAIQWPSSPKLYLDTVRSPLNPYNRGYGFFVYGTFPLFLTRMVGEVLDSGCQNGEAVSLPARWLAPVLLGDGAACWPGAFSGAGARHLGRLLAALFDTGSVLFVFLAARVLARGFLAADGRAHGAQIAAVDADVAAARGFPAVNGRARSAQAAAAGSPAVNGRARSAQAAAAGSPAVNGRAHYARGAEAPRYAAESLPYLAALLYALTVLPIQQSHFYTVDAFANFFVAATLYLALALATGGAAQADSQPQAQARPTSVGALLAQAGTASDDVSSGGSAQADPRQRAQEGPAEAGTALLPLPSTRESAQADSRPQARARPTSVGALLALLGGLATGLGVACKISVWPLGLLVALAVFLRALGQARGDLRRVVRDVLLLGSLALAGAFVAFRLAQPYTFLGPGFFGLRLNPRWLQNMAEVRGLMSGAVDTYPGHQWTNRLPLVFPWVNMVFWGMGLPLGLTAWAGWGAAGIHLVRRWRREGITAVALDPVLLPWLWGTGYFLYQGTQWVKSVRYLLPVYPAFILLAAWLLVRLVPLTPPPGPLPSPTGGRGEGAQGDFAAARGRRKIPHPLSPSWERGPGGEGHPPLSPSWERGPRGEGQSLPRAALGLLLLVTLLLTTLCWALAFTSVYRRSHTRIAASRWIFANVPTGSVLATEHWDWPPPLRVDGKDPFWGMYRGLSTSSDGTLQLYHEDTPQKRADLLNWLDEADYIIIGSNRLYASIVRLPTRYPLTIAYYRALFSGALGFELVADFTSYPALGPFQFPDTEEPFPVPEAPYQYRAAPISVHLPPAEEAFSVYDHPRVLIFRKTPAYSRARAEALLPPSLVEHVVWVTPKEETRRTWERFFRRIFPFGGGGQGERRPLLDPETWAQQQAGGTWSAMFDRESPVNRSSFLAALVWYLAASALGWLAYPILWRALPHLPDRGYSVARAVGLLVVSYLTWLAASLRILPSTRGMAALAVFLLAVAGALVAWRRWGEFRDFLSRSRTLLLVQEGLFLALFAFWALVRSRNPDLWHPVVGGEKPMDFAYLNAVVRSTWFPPYNPWFAGGYINYYYFGFVLVATLAKLTGVMPSVAYNLALALFYGLVGSAAFGVAYDLTGGLSRSDDRASGARCFSPYLAGFLAVFLLLIAGNLEEVRLLFHGLRLVAGETGFQSTIPGLEALVQALVGLGKVLAGASLPFRPETPYWNPTRIFPPDSGGVGPITEFPAFTFLYADLHAHLLALPYTLCALLLMAEWALGLRRGRPTGLSLLLAGFVVGMLRAANTWDYPTYLLLAAVVLAWRGALSERGGEHPPRFWARWLGGRSLALLYPALLVGLTVLFFLPYIRAYIAPYDRIRPWTDVRTPLPIYLRHLGVFLFPLGTWLLLETWRTLVLRGPVRFAILVGTVVLCGAVGALAGVPVAAVALPAGILAFGLALVEGMGKEAGDVRPGAPARALVWLWVAAAMALTLGVEVLVLEGDIGRMNTVFKFHFQAWTLLAVSVAVAIAHLAEDLRPWPADVRRVWWAGMGVLLAAAALFPVMSIPAKVKDRFTHATGPTLDGMAYIRYSRTGDVRGEVDLGPDYGGILWLLENVQGSPVILEGLGAREYLWEGRISIYTGLPAVVGWRWHEIQQGMGEEVTLRRAEVNECYNTPDPDRAMEILRRYGVRYVYVGPYERLYYGAVGLGKFDALAAQGKLRVVYDREGVRIYEVAGPGQQ